MEGLVMTPNEADEKLPKSAGRSCESLGVENSLRLKFLTAIGAHEYFSPEMWRAAFTELVATASLLFTLTSSIISCLESGEVDPKLLVPIAVFIIAFLFLLVTVPLSGGHMSPVFTFIAAFKGVITFVRASTYILAQCIGSILGFLIIKTVMDQNAAQKYSLGGCTIKGSGSTSGVGTQTALMVEFACTFVVLFVGVTVAFDKRRCKELGLAMVCAVVAGAMALAVFVSITVTGRVGYAGVGLNPARCLGPALLLGGRLWDGHWVFWVGPILACSVYYCVSLNLPNEGLKSVEEECDILKGEGIV
ncbi:PREDICTED: aquaporin TIP1-2-like [Prunus mume]|uniref:Aquaporin TIP1-2-like n=1 Tax=Prunus mume TaxID=102107 RepID=A0ABM0P9B9_PRUMU|nr:PREDICTED: aquaporin TIP1-2-like [Prunus mume]